MPIDIFVGSHKAGTLGPGQGSLNISSTEGSVTVFWEGDAIGNAFISGGGINRVELTLATRGAQGGIEINQAVAAIERNQPPTVMKRELRLERM